MIASSGASRPSATGAVTIGDAGRSTTGVSARCSIDTSLNSVPCSVRRPDGPGAVTHGMSADCCAHAGDLGSARGRWLAVAATPPQPTRPPYAKASESRDAPAEPPIRPQALFHAVTLRPRRAPGRWRRVAAGPRRPAARPHGVVSDPTRAPAARRPWRPLDAPPLGPAARHKDRSS
jgi:hypothetical protein